jgi:hypothetical protein
MSDTTGLRGRELAEAVLTVVQDQPDLHLQMDITCGTKACIAGWTVALHKGLRPGDELEGRVRSTRLPSVEAYELLFGGLPIDDNPWASSGYIEFLDRVFENPSEAGAIKALQSMLDRMPETVTS